MDDIQAFIVSWFEYLVENEPIGQALLVLLVCAGVVWLFKMALRQ